MNLGGDDQQISIFGMFSFLVILIVLLTVAPFAFLSTFTEQNKVA